MKLRDNLHENSQKFETNFKLRAVSQAFLNADTKWIADDLNEPDPGASPMQVDYT